MRLESQRLSNAALISDVCDPQFSSFSVGHSPTGSTGWIQITGNLLSCLRSWANGEYGEIKPSISHRTLPGNRKTPLHHGKVLWRTVDQPDLSRLPLQRCAQSQANYFHDFGAERVVHVENSIVGVVFVRRGVRANDLHA